MIRKQIELKVLVDLDPIPGAFSDEESARYYVHQILMTSIPHYNPVVLTSLDHLVEYTRNTTPGNTWICDGTNPCANPGPCDHPNHQ